MAKRPAVVWFRKDLRITDHPAFIEASKTGKPLICLFIYEPREHGLWKLGEGSTFWLYHSIKSLQTQIESLGGKLIIREGDAASILMQIVQESSADEVYWNHLYEPALIKRDAKIQALLEDSEVEVHTHHGNLLFDPKKILALNGKPFRVFAQFRKCALKFLKVAEALDRPEKILFYRGRIETVSLAKTTLYPISKLSKLWERHWRPGSVEAKRKVSERNMEVLSPYMHFGEISTREVWQKAKSKTEFKDDILFREFSQHMLLAFPHTPLQPFKEEFKKFPWVKNEQLLQRWKEGKTGYPYIDAGMRQLLQTGWMDSKARKAAASFLVKDLLIPWQEGAQWFWEKLVDADLAHNTLSWQSSAGTFTGTEPFSCILNPVEQGKKFDPEGKFIRRFLPELSELPLKYLHAPWKAPKDVLKNAKLELGKDYPLPICDHKEARENALAAYKKIAKPKKSAEEKHAIAS